MPKISNERIQRTAMLESNALLGNLLTIASKNAENLQKNIALDILIWIISIRMQRYRSPKSDLSTANRSQRSGGGGTMVGDIVADMNQQQLDCAAVVQANMTDLLRNCILHGNRSTANKCVKIILITSE